MKKLTLLSLATASMLCAAGYKIPENSVNAVALSAANIAHNHNSADAAYYNPAKMVFMSKQNHIDANVMYIGLDKVNYQGDVSLAGTPLGNHDIDSESETYIVPSLHYVSNDLGGVRIGVSIVSPGGLSKRWQDSVATFTAEEFSLQTIELNPTIALPFDGDKGGVAVGLRVVDSKGVVKSTSPASMRDMSGDSIDFGYNIAVAYKPTSAVELGVTYRSKVDLSVDGDADLRFTDAQGLFTPYTHLPAGTTYTSSSTANVTIPLPATLSLAGAYTFESATTVEFVYERNYWSSYKELNFNYGTGVNLATNTVFGTTIKKDWKDTNAFRLGITQEFTKATLMLGALYDESPVPEKTLGFELPDTNALSLSLGGRYKISESMDIGLAALYSMHEKRSVSNDSLNGDVKGGNVLLVSAGFGYRF